MQQRAQEACDAAKQAAKDAVRNVGWNVDQNNQIIGNTQPNWLMGIRNTLTWKGFRFSFLLDIREGGDLYAGTTRLLRLYGAAKETEACHQ